MNVPHGNILFGLVAVPHGNTLLGLAAAPHGNILFVLVAVPHGNISLSLPYSNYSFFPCLTAILIFFASGQ
jgi:hypothetical protein